MAITNASGVITDTFQYDTYGALVSRTGTTEVIFGYNGRDGVITDDNGLIYMRARYYSPQMRRFINTDIVPGEISDSTSLNRFAYVNGNPVSFVDPFGLAAWWETVAKIAVGVATIAILAAVTVATAGTATAVVAGAAAVGGAIGGTFGAIGGYIENGIEGAANGFLVGTVSGAASGALGASNAPAVLVGLGNAAINVGELYLEDVVKDGTFDHEVTYEDAFYAAATGFIYNQDDGLLRKGSRLRTSLKSYKKGVARESRRANRKYAAKATARLASNYNSVYTEVLGKYAYDTLTGNIGNQFQADVVSAFKRSK